MYYSKAANIILIRVPKTGSSSAQNLIGSAYQDAIENGKLHETYAEMRARIKSDFLEEQNWRIIGFVRHPIAWFDSMVSQFWHNCVHAERWFGSGLGRFDTNEKMLAGMPLTPFDWFTDADGNVRVTEVWRMEDMEKFSNSLHVPPLHLNPTPDAQHRKMRWTPRERALLEERFARELAYYPEGL